MQNVQFYFVKAINIYQNERNIGVTNPQESMVHGYIIGDKISKSEKEILALTKEKITQGGSKCILVRHDLPNKSFQSKLTVSSDVFFLLLSRSSSESDPSSSMTLAMLEGKEIDT